MKASLSQVYLRLYLDVFNTDSRVIYEINIRERLNGGTVPPDKTHPGGTVHPDKTHPGGTILLEKS